MHKGRLEAFSDGVIAIIITVMVLELKTPHGPTLAALRESAPALASYVLSFVFLGIYWNNHHHMFQAARHVSGAVLWANLHLLFWLSLIPFAVSWVNVEGISQWPVAVYGSLLFMCGVAYFILSRVLIAANGEDSMLAKALGTDVKGIVSVAIYAIGIGLAFVIPASSCALFVLVALIWLVPDRRFEDLIKREAEEGT